MMDLKGRDLFLRGICKHVTVIVKNINRPITVVSRKERRDHSLISHNTIITVLSFYP